MTRIGWAAHSANSFVRVAIAGSAALSKVVAHSGNPIWPGWWVLSPAMTPLSPSASITTPTWPRVWSGVGARRLHEEGLDGCDERTVLLGEVGKERGAALQRLRCRLPQEHALGEGDHQLDHAGDLHRAHLPAQHDVPLLRVFDESRVDDGIAMSVTRRGRLCQTADPRSDDARPRPPR